MPLPTPKEGEPQRDFISRCMGDDVMNSEYSEREQRSAVCFTRWRGKVGKTLDKDTRLEIGSPDPRVQIGGKAGEGDYGWLEGYASVFDVVDLQDEVVRKGAFAKSLKERLPAGKVKLMMRHMAHGGGVLDVLGTLTQAKEDSYGLWMHGEFAGTAAAQTARQLAAEGHIGGLSIGYLPVQWGHTEIDGKQVLELKEVKLLEVTMGVLTANEFAVITAAKAVCDQAESIERGVVTPDEGRNPPELDRGQIEGVLGRMDDLHGKLSALLTSAKPGSTVEVALHSASVDVRRKRLRLLALKAGVPFPGSDKE